MANKLMKSTPILAAAILVAGCATTPREPIEIPSGSLDYKPQPASQVIVTEAPEPSIPEPIADIQLYDFRATGQPVRLAMSQLATAYDLNIVVDQDVEGDVTVDLKQLPLNIVLEAILEPLGLAWNWKDDLLRVSRLETRNFEIDYLRLVRSGAGNSSSSTSLSGGGGGGGGSTGNSTSSIAQNDTIDFWNELEEQLETILERDTDSYLDTDRPVETSVQTDRATNITTTLTRPIRESTGRLVIDRLSGTIQVTTSRARMKNVVEFLDRVKAGIKRQVYIEAEVVEVSLSDDQSLGIDWNKIDFGDLQLATSVIIQNPVDGANALPGTLTGSYIRSFDSGELESIEGALNALREQGQVKVVSQPRIRTLNNQAAIVRVGTERTFFTTTTNIIAGDNPVVTETITPSTITEGLVLTVTPQISRTGEITMDVAPVLTRIAGVDVSPDGSSNAPVLDIKQSSTLVRMMDGQTIVVGGLIQETYSNTDRSVPGVGGVPVLGKLFSANYDRDSRRELVIFLTPHIIE